LDESLELKLSLLVCLALSGIYVAYELVTEPSGGQPFGHFLGIIGTIFMALTETLYSLRKRVRWLRLAGPVRYWLSAHIFTGIVGPFLVLTHTAFKFHGLAGFAMGLTALVVASGFVGRYLYTSVPRSLAGVQVSSRDLAAEIGRVQSSLAELTRQRSPAVQAWVEADARRKRNARSDWTMVLLRVWDEWQDRRDLERQMRQLEKTERRNLAGIGRVLTQRRSLERQMRMLHSARRLLSVWHTAHVPMGIALFGAVGLHIAAAVYFRAPP
jgi:hypothetical protein